MGVFFCSLSATFCFAVVSRLSFVFWTRSVQSSLSVLDRAGFFSSSEISAMMRAEFWSILWISSRFILMAVESRVSPASFSAAHHVSICSLEGLVPGNVSLMLIWNAFGTTFRSLSASIFSRFCVSNCLLVSVFSRAWHFPWIVFPVLGVCVGWWELGLVGAGFDLWFCFGMGLSVIRVS